MTVRRRKRFVPTLDRLTALALCATSVGVAVGVPPDLGSAPIGGVLGDDQTEPAGGDVDLGLVGIGNYDSAPLVDHGDGPDTPTDYQALLNIVGSMVEDSPPTQTQPVNAFD